MPQTRKLSIDQALSLAKQAASQGNTTQASQLYQAILARKPHHPAAKKGLQKLQERLPGNRTSTSQTTGPSHDQLNSVVGLYHSGKLTEAEQACRKLLHVHPQSVIVLTILGVTLQKQGRLEEALLSYDKAIQLNPQYAEAHSSRGNALRELGRPEEALLSYDKAIQLKPRYAEAYYNRGNTLQDLGRPEEALLSFDKAIQLNPQYAEAYCNCGITLRELSRPEEALLSFDKAIQLNPQYAEAYNNRGMTLQNLGRLEEAEAAYRRALELKPDHEDCFSNLLFLLNYDPDLSAEDIFAAYTEYDERFGLPYRDQWRPHTHPPDPDKRLRIGYVSPDFSNHSTRHFLEPVLAHHNHDRFEIIAYAEERKKDTLTSRYRGYIDHWVRTNGLSDAELAERIREDGVDILVDLAGHTARNRLGVFARKPAPVSVSWLGYGYTTGLAAIDYFLTDTATVPPGSEHLFSETPWRMGTPVGTYRPAEGMGEAGPLPAVERGWVTFGTLTRSVRINHRTIRVWSEILKQVDNARLVINSRDFRDPAAQQAMAERFALAGIEPGRLDIGFESPPWNLLRRIDITLDCFPHNSGTTLIESIFMGVPFITLADRPSVGRLGSCVLESVGHPEWIACTEDEYIEKAVALAGDLTVLSNIRAGLRGELQRSAVMDEEGFTRRLEHAYSQMFELRNKK